MKSVPRIGDSCGILVGGGRDRDPGRLLRPARNTRRDWSEGQELKASIDLLLSIGILRSGDDWADFLPL